MTTKSMTRYINILKILITLLICQSLNSTQILEYNTINHLDFLSNNNEKDICLGISNNSKKKIKLVNIKNNKKDIRLAIYINRDQQLQVRCLEIDY